MIAPSGIYAIETATIEDRFAWGQGARKGVVVDGPAFRVGNTVQTRRLRDARHSAAILAHELAEALGEQVEVKPVLALPGWQVVRHGQSDVLVLNPQEIWPAIITVAAPKLSPSQSDRIAYHIRQKCRDVEI